MKRTQILFKILIIIFLLLIIPSHARVGGGHDYGTSGSDGSSGDLGAIIAIVRLLLWLTIECPVIGVPLDIIIIIAIIYYSKNKGRYRNLTVNQNYTCSTSNYNPVVNISQKIKAYQKQDPNFSKPLFIDFANLLFTKVYDAKGIKNFEGITPYVTPEVIAQLKQPNISKIDDIIVGALNIDNITTRDSFDEISVTYESNYTEYLADGKKSRFYSKETWTLRRKKGVLSKGPDDISTFHCPACGSPSEITPDGKCQFCGNVVNTGAYHWQLSKIIVLNKTFPEPINTNIYGAEKGLEVPTLYDVDFSLERKSFMTRHPDFVWDAFVKKVKEIFLNLQNSWSSLDWEKARPYETDYLFSTHRYWIEKYKAQGLRNVLEDITIENVTPVKIERDAYYESMTVRIYALMKDYTVDKTGKFISGSKTTKRRFSEYWTFIRYIGAQKNKDSEDGMHCPNCGAAININMAGLCQYCNSKITSGKFDWVLSTIEQDESYSG